MAEYSRMARGSFTSTGAAKIINLPFKPQYVEFENYTAYATPANHGIPWAKWDVNMGQGSAVVGLFNATPLLITDDVQTNGISTFDAGTLLQYGARQQIVGATAANPIVFNVTAHGYSVGDTVVFEGLYQSSTTGMAQIAGIPFIISAVGDANHFSVVWPGDGSNYTALSGSPTGSYVRKVLYPDLYLPGVNFIEDLTLASTTTVVTTTNHNYVVGQQVAFRIPQSWGTAELNSLPNNIIPGSPIYGYVVSVTDNKTFDVNINSTGYTAFTTNQTIASVPGLSFPQVVAVGDVNTGGEPIYSGSNLYPSPLFPTSTNGSPTINGPAIKGAYINNTRQGFVIGVGKAAGDSSSVLVGAEDDVIYWRAYLFDYSA